MYKKKIRLFVYGTLLLSLSIACYSQQKKVPQYPSLLWEITGNGLTKPSYLFGTMHVSSKMAFHLSDSFYLALKSVDAVALELNPDTWQEQMVTMNKMKQNYLEYTQTPYGEYFNENSFRINKYDDDLKIALSSEPMAVNYLLYRSYKSQEDFEEDTFLDLYIYQTGKKLGKRITAVEDYFESEKIIMEAYADMAKEKKKSTRIDFDDEDDIFEKSRDAYRRGDLDLMDSLDRITDRSEAFTEKFLFKRNEIQANSIDTIIRKSSLFVGVGAAHLPGKRGVIELLRNKGYSLRPIFMADRDAVQKEAIDKLKAPVNLTKQYAEDSLYSVDMPGPLSKMIEEYTSIDSKQYADMGNGAYYLVTRVKTHAAFIEQGENIVLRKIDSMLYENIPGKILAKKEIARNGYSGYDITNRTRRGDLQRYHIFVTPFEVVLFKLSGKENYVESKEAERFFSSIRLKNSTILPVFFEPEQGGFSIAFPQSPTIYFNEMPSDGIGRWEYEAVDKSTGDVYLILKKSAHNFHFIEEDSFDLSLMEESFKNPAYFDRQQSRKLGSFNGYPCLTAKEKMKDGAIVHVKYIIKGPHYYLIAVKTKNKKAGFKNYFNSFAFTDTKYNVATTAYVDTFMHFKVHTPIVLKLDKDFRKQIEETSVEVAKINASEYWPEPRNALFKSHITGEKIAVSILQYPKYYYVKDSLQFWNNEIIKFYQKGMLLYKKEFLQFDKDINGCKLYLRDTGSSRTITRLILQKDNHLFSLVTMGDTISKPGSFINSFFSTFKPHEKKLGKSIYENNLKDFFTDLFSKDSITQIKAQRSISKISYSEKDVPEMIDAIGKLNISYKNYFNTKANLITELGYIKDTLQPVVVNSLKDIFEKTADTTFFQNEIFMALARHKTKAAYTLFKELITQDPPIFESSFSYNTLFETLHDSLSLTKELFPELLQLSSLDDYKDQVMSLLSALVDSNIIKPHEYENYFPKIYFDAKIELKKQLGKDEKQLSKESERDDYEFTSYSNDKNSLNTYSILLMPFYDKNKHIQKFFERLLQSNDFTIKLNTAILLLRNNQKVADSILQKLAAEDKCRAKLFFALEKLKRLDVFPAKYNNQVSIARSLLIAGNKNHYNKIDSVVLVSKHHSVYKNKKGVVYFFKYRLKGNDNWKIGFSGLQPENKNEMANDVNLVVLTDKKLKLQEQQEQFQKELKKVLFSSHESGIHFYNTTNYYNRKFSKHID